MAKINVIKPSFEILSDHMLMVPKAAKMARICYRTEDPQDAKKEAEMLNSCITAGHTSVIEHGYMSVFFPQTPIDPKKFGDDRIQQPLSASMIWSQFNSDDINKYAEITGDNQIYKYIDGANAPMKVYPVVVTNFRAWLNIIDSSMACAIQQGAPIAVAFTAGLLLAANKQFPEIFGNLVNKVNEAFSHADDNHYLTKIFRPTDEKVLKIEHLAKYYDLFNIVAAPACSRYTLSVILRTDRATTHQIVRHRRDVNYSQESQRYCNYLNKGYDVIWPAIDPKRFEGGKLESISLIPEGKTEAEVQMLDLEDDGYLPQKSSAYNTWIQAMEIAISHYELMLASRVKKVVYQTDDKGAYVYTADGKPVVKEVKDITIPPESARMVLPNSFATTIGITWTPATFTNLVRWRLDAHAQWSFRSLLGKIIVEGLRTHHEFFENFMPKMIIKWLHMIQDQKICTDEKLISQLIEGQDKRQQNLEKAAEDLRKRMEAEKEARAKALAEKTKTPMNPAEAETADVIKPAPKMGAPVGPGRC